MNIMYNLWIFYLSLFDLHVPNVELYNQLLIINVGAICTILQLKKKNLALCSNHWHRYTNVIHISTELYGSILELMKYYFIIYTSVHFFALSISEYTILYLISHRCSFFSNFSNLYHFMDRFKLRFVVTIKSILHRIFFFVRIEALKVIKNYCI